MTILTGNKQQIVKTIRHNGGSKMCEYFSLKVSFFKERSLKAHAKLSWSFISIKAKLMQNIHSLGCVNFPRSFFSLFLYCLLPVNYHSLFVLFCFVFFHLLLQDIFEACLIVSQVFFFPLMFTHGFLDRQNLTREWQCDVGLVVPSQTNSRRSF